MTLNAANLPAMHAKSKQSPHPNHYYLDSYQDNKYAGQSPKAYKTPETLEKTTLQSAEVGKPQRHHECCNMLDHTKGTNPMAMLTVLSPPLVRRRQLPFSALAEHRFLVRERGSGTLAAMERLFAKHQTPLDVVMEMPSNETIKQAVMAGMRMSFLSLRTGRHELPSGHIALIDVEELAQDKPRRCATRPKCRWASLGCGRGRLAQIA